MLLEAGANPSATGNRNSTILMDALRGAHLEIAKLFIEYGADLKAGDGYHTPLSLAEMKVQLGNVEMQEVVDLIKSKLKNN